MRIVSLAVWAVSGMVCTFRMLDLREEAESPERANLRYV